VKHAPCDVLVVRRDKQPRRKRTPLGEGDVAGV